VRREREIKLGRQKEGIGARLPKKRCKTHLQSSSEWKGRPFEWERGNRVHVGVVRQALLRKRFEVPEGRQFAGPEKENTPTLVYKEPKGRFAGGKCSGGLLGQQVALLPSG